jgi:YrbI family 3-deoxy-D-manno-octulosonate 8-phosphate phosphatase
MSNFNEMCSKIKLIISEVDGVITDGLSAIDNMNNTLFKMFYTRDFEALNLLKKHFIFVFLSSDNNVSYNIMRTRNIPFYWARGDKSETTKKAILSNIMHKYGVTPEEVLFVGSTFSDVECFNMIPLSVCPKDSVASIKRIVSLRKDLYGRSGILNVEGGKGVISELYEILLPTIRKNLDK